MESETIYRFDVGDYCYYTYNTIIYTCQILHQIGTPYNPTYHALVLSLNGRFVDITAEQDQFSEGIFSPEDQVQWSLYVMKN